MKPSTTVDYNLIPSRQTEIDGTLINWARWCRSGPGGSKVLPMFQGYRDGYWAPPEATVAPIDVPQAVEVQKTMAHIPERNRIALQWAYIIRTDPVRVARYLAVTKDGLRLLIEDGRDMVKNRMMRSQLTPANNCA